MPSHRLSIASEDTGSMAPVKYIHVVPRCGIWHIQGNKSPQTIADTAIPIGEVPVPIPKVVAINIIH